MRIAALAVALLACQPTPRAAPAPRRALPSPAAQSSASASALPRVPRLPLVAETPEARAAARHARELWGTVSLEPHRASIEHYVPVARDEELPLDGAEIPFAHYLHAFHSRLHSLFADQFLRSLELLPESHLLNGRELFTRLEVVLDPAAGRVARLGVIISSGVTAFDVSALEAVRRAAPFGPAPQAIVSPDGLVYFHQSFYRLPTYACSNYFSWPILRKPTPEASPVGAPAP